MAEEQQQPVQEQIVRFLISIFFCLDKTNNVDSVVFSIFSIPIDMDVRLFKKKVITYDADITKTNTLNQKKSSWSMSPKLVIWVRMSPYWNTTILRWELWMVILCIEV